MLGSAQLRVSNLMIKQLIALGYTDDRWEDELVDALHTKQLASLQRSTAFMTAQEALSYYRLDTVPEEGGER